MTPILHQCRYCKNETTDNVLFEYSANHWAHYTCWLDRHGIDGWRKLNKYLRPRFPAMALAEAGVLWNEISQWIDSDNDEVKP